MNFLIVTTIAAAIALFFLISKKETTKGASGGTIQKSYNSLDEWKSDLTTLWSGDPIDIEFTYESKSGKIRRTVTLKRVAKNSREQLYLIGKCHIRNEERTFHLDSVTTMIKFKSKRYHHCDFLSEVLGMDIGGYSFRV